MSDELEACPFCGGEAELKSERGPTGERYRWVECSGCYAAAGQCDESARWNNPEEPDATAAWNTRAPDPRIAQLEAEVAGLREASQAVLAAKTDFYTARNGRKISIQGDDGEMCWIVHSDSILGLEQALSGEPRDG